MDWVLPYKLYTLFAVKAILPWRLLNPGENWAFCKPLMVELGMYRTSEQNIGRPCMAAHSWLEYTRHHAYHYSGLLLILRKRQILEA
jgi:hypothetical protein